MALKGKQFHGYDFHRQKPIGNYIVDFYCPELELVLEIDGMSHYQKYEYDQKRQKDLENLGLFVLRFTEGDVCGNLEGVLIALEEWVKENGSR